MKKLDRWRCAALAYYKKSIQIVSQQDIKGPNAMANLVWANTFYIFGYIMHDSVGFKRTSYSSTDY